MGLPSLEIEFKQRAVEAIKKGTYGTVGIIIKDNTAKDKIVQTYKNITEIVASEYTENNQVLITRAFTHNPKKVIVIRITQGKTISDVLPLIPSLGIDWVISLDAGDQNTLATWIKSTDINNLGIKALVWKVSKSDNKQVVNLINQSVKFVPQNDGQTVFVDALEYLPSLVGLLASTPLNQSVTYKDCTDIEDVDTLKNVENLIDTGNLCLIKDDEGVKIARGVNTLTTITADNTEDMKDILIVEQMDLIKKDLKKALKKKIGNYKNNLNNQNLILSIINGYLKILSTLEILDNEYDNEAVIDIEMQRNKWLEQDKQEASDWDEFEIKQNTFKKYMFVILKIKMLNAIEDFKITVNLF